MGLLTLRSVVSFDTLRLKAGRKLDSLSSDGYRENLPALSEKERQEMIGTDDPLPQDILDMFPKTDEQPPS